MATIAGPCTVETGDLTQFSANGVAGTATVAAATAAAKNGTYGVALANTNTSDNTNQAYVQRSFTNPASNVVVCDSWFRYRALPATGAYGIVGSKFTHAILAADASIWQVAWTLIVSTNGTLNGIRPVYATRANVWTFAASALIMSTTWTLLRTIFDRSGANPTVTWKYSTDGTTFTTHATVTDSGAGTNGIYKAPGYLYGGVIHNVNFESFNYTIDIDDMTVYDADPSATATYLPPRNRNIFTPPGLAAQWMGGNDGADNHLRRVWQGIGAARRDPVPGLRQGLVPGLRDGVSRPGQGWQRDGALWLPAAGLPGLSRHAH